MENKVITLVQLQKALLREDANDKKELEALSQEIKKSANTLEEKQNEHVADNNNPHGVTKEQVGLGNVENKSSEDIRGELTKENVVNALGYNPPRTDTIYTHPSSAGNKHIPAGGAVDQVLRWKSDGEAVWGDLPDAPNIPDKLPNPKALSFSGGINATYDGSVAVKISLPETPTKLPNPKSLKFTGAVVGEYDGSSELSIEIPEGSASDQVQGDWNQNDKTAAGYINNRTHWIDDIGDEVFPKAKLKIVKYQGGGNEYTQSERIGLEAHKTYVIEWNDVRYEVGSTEAINSSGKTLGVTCRVKNESGSTVIIIDDQYETQPAYLNRPAYMGRIIVYDGSEVATLSIHEKAEESVYHPLDEKFIPDSIARDEDKLDRFNPSGIGTFSMNRKANTSVGPYSTAMGYSATASGNASHAEGYQTIATGSRQHVQGQYNVADPNSKYYHIVGNGKSDSSRSNAHTIDRNGLGWFAGGLKVGGVGQDDENAEYVALKSDLDFKIDRSEITVAIALEIAIEHGLIHPIYHDGNIIYTDSNGAILLFN